MKSNFLVMSVDFVSAKKHEKFNELSSVEFLSINECIEKFFCNFYPFFAFVSYFRHSNE